MLLKTSYHLAAHWTAFGRADNDKYNAKLQETISEYLAQAAFQGHILSKALPFPGSLDRELKTNISQASSLNKRAEFPDDNARDKARSCGCNDLLIVRRW